jgi:hypothetical protein
MIYPDIDLEASKLLFGKEELARVLKEARKLVEGGERYLCNALYHVEDKHFGPASSLKSDISYWMACKAGGGLGLEPWAKRSNRAEQEFWNREDSCTEYRLGWIDHMLEQLK